MFLSLTPEVQDIFKTIFQFAKKRKIKLYLVGGYLRDIILKRERVNPDIDFCLKKGAISLGRQLARRLKTGFVVLDKEHGCCRLVKRIDDKIYTLDFTDFRGKNLEEDLLHRDFTINTMALELDNLILNLKKGFFERNLNNFIIDPYQGRKDLKLKLIRIVNKKGFDEDPLRILRAFSLAAIFGFKIDKETLRLIKLRPQKLSNVSFERIRDELFKIFEQKNSFDFLSQVNRLKILKIIIPEIEVMRGVKQGPYHHLDVFQHTLETIRQLEILIQELKRNKQVQDYLDEVISSERRRKGLIKLGALLHDIGKPKALRYEDGKTKFHGHEKIGLEITKTVAERLRLSNDELDSLKIMVLRHLRPGYLADNEKLTQRAIFRYFRDTDKEAVSTLLLSIADQRATKGPLTTDESRAHHERIVFGLIKEYFKRKKEKRLPRLITGDDLINKFRLSPSPLIGKILREIEELQATGKIKTKKDALKVAKKLIDAK